jgi:hypothetical protein
MVQKRISYLVTGVAMAFVLGVGLVCGGIVSFWKSAHAQDFTEIELITEIKSAQDFLDFNNSVCEYFDYYSGVTVNLLADINLQDLAEGTEPYIWENVDLPNLIFNGNGHSISGLFCENNDFDDSGLFGTLRGTSVNNLTLEHPIIFASENMSCNFSAGALAGNIYGAQIRNVTINEPEIFVDASSAWNGRLRIGTVCGAAYEGDTENDLGLFMSIINGVNVFGGNITVVYDSVGIGTCVGGIVGENYKSVVASSGVWGTEINVDMKMTFDCFVCVGGICGYSSATEVFYGGTCILNCFSSAEISASVQWCEYDDMNDKFWYNIDNFAGGICGIVKNDSVVNCLWVGTDLPMFGQVDNAEGEYTVSHNITLGNYADYTSTVKAQLNDATEPDGGMWVAATVTDADTGYGMEEALKRYRTWTTGEFRGEAVPMFGAWYTPDGETEGGGDEGGEEGNEGGATDGGATIIIPTGDGGASKTFSIWLIIVGLLLISLCCAVGLTTVQLHRKIKRGKGL